MKLLFLILQAAFFLTPIRLVAQDYKQEKKILETKMKEARITSAGFAVIKNGEVAYKSALGYLDNSKKKKTTTATLYNVASISKSLTAWGVLKLVETGRIKLESPVNDYLKRWKAPFYQNDTTQITVQMLLRHTAGLSMGAVTDYAPGKIIPSLPNAVADLKVIQKPGQAFRYSGGGYMVLQLLIEDVTGKRFSVYMQEEILKPLGMVNSTFDMPGAGTNVATPYDETLKAAPQYSFVGTSAAGLYTSVDDLSKFVIASMALKSNPVLKKESIDLIKEKISKNYAAGYALEQIDSVNTLMGHGGANSGWRATYYFNAAGDGIVLMANSSFNDFSNAGLCHWISQLYRVESVYCSKSVYTSLIIDLFTKGQDYTAKRISKIQEETGTKDILAESYFNSVGYWLMRLERWDGARTFFEMSARLYPNSANAFDSLGDFYENSKENEKAIKAYEKAIELNPELQSSKQGIQRLQQHNK